MLAFELIDKVVDKTVVEVLTTQVSITSGGLDLEDTLLDGEERDIESSSSQVEDQHVALTFDLLVKAVGDGGGGGLVDDTEDVETSNKTGILGGLTLGVVEVGWDSHDSVIDGSTEVGLSSLPHLGQHHGGDLFGCELLVLALELNLDNRLAGLLDDLEGKVLHVGLDFRILELPPDETLGIEDGVCGVHGDLILCGVANETLGVCEGDEGGGGAVALVIGNDFDTVVPEHADAAVGRAQVDTDGWSGRHGECGCVLTAKCQLSRSG